MSKLRLMSQNQWDYTNNAPYWEERGLDCSSKVRMAGHCRVIQEIMPDVIGGQEVNKDMQLDLMVNFHNANLPHTLIWGNMTPIIYRADKFELLESEFLMYPRELEGYEGEFNNCQSKSANLAVFKCKEDDEIFVFLTTHLWWKNGTDPESPYYQEGSDIARREQIQKAISMVEKYQKKYNNCPAFIVGDLNADYNSNVISYAIKEKGFSHGHDIATEFSHEGKGYNPCFPWNIGPWEDAPFEKAIDHILIKPEQTCTVLRFDRYTPDYYIYLSDHAPVYVDIELKK